MCECCDQELDFLDTIQNKVTSACFSLFICHNEDCEEYGSIYNDKIGNLLRGDASGLF